MTGSLVDLCKLVDVNHRLSRAVTHDDALVSNFITREQKRLENSEIVVHNRAERLLMLQSGDSGENTNSSSSCSSSSDITVMPSKATGLNEAVNKLNREMSVRSQTLLEAEEEVEKARLVSLVWWLILIIIFDLTNLNCDCHRMLVFAIVRNTIWYHSHLCNMRVLIMLLI